jgi:hypothetical protein
MFAGQIPLWLKIGYTVFVCILVPIYWLQYGPANFLWFSDISLFTVTLALWLHSSLLASTMAVGVLLLELFWNFDFFARLIFGFKAGGISAYMFDSARPLYLRLLSLFHVVLPPILFWLVYVLGYDRRAFFTQTLLAWIVLPLSYLFTTQKANINWVLGFGNKPQEKLRPLFHLILMMLAFPVLVYFPSHVLLSRFLVKT